MRTAVRTFFALAVFVAIAIAQTPVLTVCEVVRNPEAYRGLRILVRGIVGGVEGGSIASPDFCPGQKVRSDREEILLSWGYAQRVDPKPTHTAVDDVYGTVEGFLSWNAPDEIVLKIDRIGDWQVVRPAYMSVCEVLRTRRELEGTMVSVRGAIFRSEQGLYLRASDCPLEINEANRSWSSALWVDGWAEYKSLMPKVELEEQAGRFKGSETVVTVTGIFRSTDGVTNTVRGRLLGSVAFEWVRHVEFLRR